MRNFRSSPAQRRDHYQELTDKIIAALETGTAPWRRPWNPNACGGSTAPVNAATGRRYRGVNLFVLGMSPLAFASGDPRWCSYRQALARGWQVRRGEKATPVYFYKPIEITDKTSESEGETRRVPILRAFSVFHASQIDGMPTLAPAGATKTVIERVEDAEIILKASGVPVRIGGDRAFYNPAGDFIQLPPDEAFESQPCEPASPCTSCHTRAATRRDSIAICPENSAHQHTRAKNSELNFRACSSAPRSGCRPIFPITQATFSPGSTSSRATSARSSAPRLTQVASPNGSSRTIRPTPPATASPTRRTMSSRRSPRPRP